MNYSKTTMMLLTGSLLLSGCARYASSSPSQNSSLQAVSPSSTTTSEPGMMQRSLDSWLREEWTPLTAPKSSASTVQPKSTTLIPQTSRANAVVDIESNVDAQPFTLQTYVDKWKVYHEKKEKMNEGKPKEAANSEKLESMPVIGK